MKLFGKECFLLSPCHPDQREVSLLEQEMFGSADFQFTIVQHDNRVYILKVTLSDSLIKYLY